MGVLTGLQNRGLEDILIACAGGLTGFPEAVRAVFPAARVQLCIAHMARNSAEFVSCKGLKALCAGLEKIYTAAAEQAGRDALEEFGKRRDPKYPVIYKSWDARRKDPCEFYNYPEEIRKAIYTANAIEPLNFQLRKVTRSRLAFVNDDAIYKIMYLAIRNASEKRAIPIRNWGMALHQFAIIFGSERVPF